jgi:transcriptional regulator with XRE-family HTH domain
MQERTLGELIAEKRKERCLTQAALAAHFGISDKAVSKWERNLSRPEGNHMVELVELLDLPREYLPPKESFPTDGEEREYLPPRLALHPSDEKSSFKARRLSLHDVLILLLTATLLAISAGISTGCLTVEQGVPILGACNALLAWSTLCDERKG